MKEEGRLGRLLLLSLAGTSVDSLFLPVCVTMGQLYVLSCTNQQTESLPPLFFCSSRDVIDTMTRLSLKKTRGRLSVFLHVQIKFKIETRKIERVNAAMPLFFISTCLMYWDRFLVRSLFGWRIVQLISIASFWSPPFVLRTVSAPSFTLIGNERFLEPS